MPVALAHQTHFGSVRIKNGLVMGGYILGENLLQLGIHLVTVGFSRLHSSTNATKRHKCTLRGLIGLQTHYFFQMSQTKKT